jgi:hypothetical protein
MMGVNDGIADLKRHLASTPSTEGYLTTARACDKTSLLANMQVNTLISSTRQYAQQTSAAAGYPGGHCARPAWVLATTTTACFVGADGRSSFYLTIFI